MCTPIEGGGLCGKPAVDYCDTQWGRYWMCAGCFDEFSVELELDDVPVEP